MTDFRFQRAPGEEPLLQIDAVNEATRWGRSPLYSILWLAEGRCLCRSDRLRQEVHAPALIFASPFQDLALLPDGEPFRGRRIRFHGDFYCIERHKAEVSCNGVIFNNVYSSPCVALDPESHQQVARYLDLLAADFCHAGEAGWQDMAVAHLKILLIIATRLKRREVESVENAWPDAAQPTLLRLRQLIEANFREWHRPSDYAAALQISGNALAKLTKRHLLKTPTELIVERSLLEAKRLLHFSTLSVKEIAFQLGFTDFGYFGRLFKRHTGITPTEYRQRVGIVLLE
jgi:AraC family transcriptional activator of pobA